MRRSFRLAAVSAAALFVGATTLAAGPLRADDKPAGDAPKAEGKDAPKDGPKADAPKADAKDAVTVSRLEKAKKLVIELETMIAVMKAVKTVDAETMKALEKALEEARALAKPITLAELTEDEKMNIGEELRKQFEKGGAADGDKGPGDKGPGGGPGDEWRKQAVAAAFKDVEVTEEEQIAAQKVIEDWFAKSRAAQFSGESKRVSDLKRDRDTQLEKTLGKKKAQKVINNLNAMSGRR